MPIDDTLRLTAYRVAPLTNAQAGDSPEPKRPTPSVDVARQTAGTATSCTNTSNPEVMVAAALLARNAVRRGLRSQPWVKTSLSPGSRVVTDYFDKAGLTPYLEQLGFNLTGYGCINPDVRLNYLASPPLVVAYALAGTMDVDLTTDPLGTGTEGEPVHLRDIWPSTREVREVIDGTLDAAMFTRAYADVFTGDERWRALDSADGATFSWDEDSTYVRRPPYFDDLTADPLPVRDIRGARALVKLGDSVTTDHLSPAGAIPPHTPAGRYLTGLGVRRFDLNTYASRRGNHEVMMRGTLANVRLRNHLVPGSEGGTTLDFTDGEAKSVYDAAMSYRSAGVPLLILAGRDYGAGSSRDWAAKGPALLGVKAVLAESFERIHRSNLIGMAVLPLQFLEGDNADSLGLTGRETFHVIGLADARPGASRRQRPCSPTTAGSTSRSGSTRSGSRSTTSTAASSTTC